MASPDRLCRHCELPLPDESSSWVREGFCCRGCKTVHGVLQAGGLDRYYALRDGAGVPVGELPDEHDLGWIEELRAAPSPRIEIDVQGMHCAGCVWVIEKLFERHGSGSLELNPTLGRAELLVGDDYDLEGFARDVEALGYRLGPAGEESRSKSDGLLLRTGICLALAGNGMFYAAATYFGLDEGPIYRLLSQMAYGAAALAVLVGGSVFIRAAWQALRRGVVHLDLPIALGILLSFAGASWSYFTGGEARYVDTVTIFIALMLLGRWLQERVLERNRRQLLDDRGAESLRTRRVVESEGSEQIRLVRAVEIDAGDLLHLAAGDLVPVDAELLDAEGSFSLDWIDGESEPRPYRRGEVVPAGAFHVGRTARRMRAAQPFEDSAVRRLLRRPQARDDDGAAWWQRIAKWYVAGVLLAAGAAIAVWWGLAGAPHTAVEVATAVLVVTCPCAFGIATPLAYELAHARLRRRGLFVRTRSFLDRARALRRLVFDKTGTLTTGRLSLADEAPLDALDDEARAVLAALAASNAHPKS
ncbi:MAG TPA: heavy metal translocating P-type ATPase metal-binding domain-containing protein, partial [Polyangiaceae bacterium LLY-WYZ-15_(1-7)]|nr:heavy metal translocating P-type ATPase metal-binding domain-containing protein [Polyangiaceae bacterium LLY-WYZ-15_(1-7)]